MTRKKGVGLLVSLAFPLIAGFLVSILTRSGMEQYATLIKPPLSPPGWIFGVVWPILYIMMGLAAWLVWLHEDNPDRSAALGWYSVQLVLNLLWSVWFFKLEWRLFAFFWLLLLILTAGITAYQFFSIRKLAGLLMLPYLLWLLFAAYLNFGVWILNR